MKKEPDYLYNPNTGSIDSPDSWEQKDGLIDVTLVCHFDFAQEQHQNPAFVLFTAPALIDGQTCTVYYSQRQKDVDMNDVSDLDWEHPDSLEIDD